MDTQTIIIPANDVGKEGTPASSTTTTRKKRRTPTERQIAALNSMTEDDLIGVALDALYALNRRAKQIRDHRKAYRRASFSRALERAMNDIYNLKDGFLTALVRTGRATVETFEIEREDGYSCEGCERHWYGLPDCFGCGCEGYEEYESEDWYVIDCGDGIRFHQPEVPADVAALAVKVEPHEPTQTAKEIPKVGLTIEAQRAAVRMATAMLDARAVNIGAATQPTGVL